MIVAPSWLSASTEASWAPRGGGDVACGGACPAETGADTAGGGEPTSVPANGHDCTMSEATISLSIGSTQAGGRAPLPGSSVSGSGGTGSGRSQAAQESVAGTQSSSSIGVTWLVGPLRSLPPAGAVRSPSPVGTPRRRHRRRREPPAPALRLASPEPPCGACGEAIGLPPLSKWCGRTSHTAAADTVPLCLGCLQSLARWRNSWHRRQRRGNRHVATRWE